MALITLTNLALSKAKSQEEICFFRLLCFKHMQQCSLNVSKPHEQKINASSSYQTYIEALWGAGPP